MDAITTHLHPLGVNFATGTAFASTKSSPALAGGFFTYIRLPPDIPDAETVYDMALERYNLKLTYGLMFRVWGDEESGKRKRNGFGGTMRLCWAWNEEGVLEQGIRKRLARLIGEIRSGRR